MTKINTLGRKKLANEQIAEIKDRNFVYQEIVSSIINLQQHCSDTRKTFIFKVIMFEETINSLSVQCEHSV